MTCRCMTPPFNYRDFESRVLGDDPKHDGEASIEICRHCGTLWLQYFFKDPGFSRSGRWWRAVLPPDAAPTVRPETALDHIGSAEYHFIGGSYFGSTGKCRDCPRFSGSGGRRSGHGRRA